MYYMLYSTVLLKYIITELTLPKYDQTLNKMGHILQTLKENDILECYEN